MSKLSPENLLVPTEANVSQIMSAYNISVDHFEHAQSGIENLTLIIHSNSKKYVLRVYAEAKRSDEQIQLELEFMHELRSSGLRVPKVYTNNYEQALSQPIIDGKLWRAIVMEHAPGGHVDRYTPKLLADMADLQAKMHNLGEQFDCEFRPLEATYSFREEHITEKLIANESTDARYLGFIERANDFKLDLSHDLPCGVSHFDFDKDNLFVQDDCVSGILDFGDVDYLPLVICLGYTLWDVMFEDGGSEQAAYEYVQRYELSSRLIGDEKQALVPIILFRHYVITCMDIYFGDMTPVKFEQAVAREQMLLSSPDFF